MKKIFQFVLLSLLAVSAVAFIHGCSGGSGMVSTTATITGATQ